MDDKSRAYLTSHPFLKFKMEISHAGSMLWLALGEAQSKCDHISGVPLRPSVANELHRLSLVKGVQATTAIEGNTLTEGEVGAIIDGSVTVPPSKEYLAQEVRNIVEACDEIVGDLWRNGAQPLTVERIRYFNETVLKGLELPDHVVPGQTRKVSVGVGKYRGAPWEDCDFLLERLTTWLDSDEFKAPSPDLEIAFALLKAIVSHLYLAWIHPFGDGNGRTARLLEVQILMSAGVSTPAAHLLSNHYNQTRTDYYRQLDRASASGGDILPFVRYAMQGFVDGLRSQLGLIRKQQLEVAWEAHVHDVFDGAKTAVAIRRRHLVLDLGRLDHPVPANKLLDISTRVAADYAKLSSRTLFRDTLQLMQPPHRLIRFDKESGFYANKALIEAFLPARRAE